MRWTNWLPLLLGALDALPAALTDMRDRKTIEETDFKVEDRDTGEVGTQIRLSHVVPKLRETILSVASVHRTFTAQAIRQHVLFNLLQRFVSLKDDLVLSCEAEMREQKVNGGTVKAVGQIDLDRFFGSGVVLSIPKGEWELVTAADLEAATPAIEPGDIVIVVTGWHRFYSMFYRFGFRRSFLIGTAGATLTLAGGRAGSHSARCSHDGGRHDSGQRI